MLAAGGADEVRLHVRQPDVIGPAVGAERCGVAAPVIAVRTPETRRTKSGMGVLRGGFSVQ